MRYIQYVRIQDDILLEHRSYHQPSTKGRSRAFATATGYELADLLMRTVLNSFSNMLSADVI